MLNGGNEIILANWPNDKHIICTINNDILIEIPSHPYILVNRSILCNCSIEAENNFLLESLATCHNRNTKLIMYFTVNTAFTNYSDQFNLTEELEMPTFTNKSASEFTLPVFLNKSTFDDTLLSAPLTLKEYTAQYKHEKEIFDLKERHAIDELDIEFSNKKFFTHNFIFTFHNFTFHICILNSNSIGIVQYKHEKEIFDLKERHDIDELDIEFSNKNFFTHNSIVDIFVFVIAIILVITTMTIIYTLCKHNKLRALVVSLALQQVKEVNAAEVRDKNYKCKCISQFYVILPLSIVIIGLVVFAILQFRRIRLCRGQLFLQM